MLETFGPQRFQKAVSQKLLFSSTQKGSKGLDSAGRAAARQGCRKGVDGLNFMINCKMILNSWVSV